MMGAVSCVGELVAEELLCIRTGTDDTAPHISKKTITAVIPVVCIESPTTAPVNIVLNMIKEIVYERI